MVAVSTSVIAAMAAARLDVGLDRRETSARSGWPGWSISSRSTMLALRSRSHFDQPDRVGVRADQILVAEFKPGRRDRSGDHVLTAAEVVGVMRVSGGAVGQRHRGLP